MSMGGRGSLRTSSRAGGRLARWSSTNRDSTSGGIPRSPLSPIPCPAPAATVGCGAAPVPVRITEVSLRLTAHAAHAAHGTHRTSHTCTNLAEKGRWRRPLGGSQRRGEDRSRADLWCRRRAGAGRKRRCQGWPRGQRRRRAATAARWQGAWPGAAAAAGLGAACRPHRHRPAPRPAQCNVIIFARGKKIRIINNRNIKNIYKDIKKVEVGHLALVGGGGEGLLLLLFLFKGLLVGLFALGADALDRRTHRSRISLRPAHRQPDDTTHDTHDTRTTRKTHM